VEQEQIIEDLIKYSKEKYFNLVITTDLLEILILTRSYSIMNTIITAAITYKQ